jgi:plastocyanin
MGRRVEMQRRLGFLSVALVAALVASAGAASAADRPEIAVSIDKDQFQPSEIKVKANTPFTLVVTNKNPKAIEFESKDLRIEKVVPPGKTVNVQVRALKPGTYSFFDDYNKAATGRIVAE